MCLCVCAAVVYLAAMVAAALLLLMTSDALFRSPVAPQCVKYGVCSTSSVCLLTKFGRFRV